MYVRRLKERQNVIEVFRVTHPHDFLVLEAPEPKYWCGQVIAQKHTLLCAIIVSGIGDVRMLPWQMTCYIGAKNMPVTFKIMTEGVSPQFVEGVRPQFLDRCCPGLSISSPVNVNTVFKLCSVGLGQGGRN